MQSIDAGGSAITLHSFLRMKGADNAWNLLAQNDVRFYATIAPVGNDLVRGRIPLAYIDANSIIAQAKEGAPVKMIFPSEGLASFGAFGNVTATAKHPNAAKVWMNYVTSKHGSSIMSTSGAYGTHPDATPPAAPGYTFPPSNKVWTISTDQWDKIHESWVQEWKDVVLKK
jgi:iron(III) transport system substrate-binding protein